MSLKPDYMEYLNIVPDHMHHTIVGWIEDALPIGDFLMALLSNDLIEAFGRAGDENITAMHRWVKYLYNHTPRGCHGSPAKVKAWREAGGLRGMGLLQ